MVTTEKHKLAAIVFTDLVGFTKIMGRDEQEGLELLQKQRDLFYPIVESFNGTVLKELGDGLLIMFDSSIRSVRASLQIQEVAKENDINLRIGIHIGDVVIKDKDIIGSGVNVASRIEPLAETGGICVSEDVWYQIRNQKGIFAISLGKKNLKNVKRSIEIFKLVHDEITLKAERIFFAKNLWQRRVPQIFILYLGACWAIVEFVSSLLVDRYLLSPHLIDFSIVTLLSLIPSILLLSYFHGKPGKDEWTKVEKIGIPLNIILVILILFFTFQGKDLGAVTKTISVENEEGEQVERIIPKSEFRKSIAIFPFESTSNDTTFNWLQFGIPYITQNDLSQDIYISATAANDFYNEIELEGFKECIGIPLMLKMKIANELHLQYFLTGYYAVSNDSLTIKVTLHDTKLGQLISESEFSGNDIFMIVDELTLHLKQKMEIPNQHIKSVKDLPVSEIFTNSVPAFKLFMQGLMAKIIHNDFETELEEYENAVKIDSTFAEVYIKMLLSYKLSNKESEFKKIVPKAMQYIYKLTERKQFILKYFECFFNSLNMSKALKLCEMWIDLYPDDIVAREYLAGYYDTIGDLDKAIFEYQQILNLVPDNYHYLSNIGTLYKRITDFKEAMKYYQLYKENLPDDYRSYENIADLYYLEGNYQEAKKYFEKAIILEPDNIDISIKIANINKNSGSFEKALDEYKNILDKCRIPEEKAQVLVSIADYYFMKGQMNYCFEYQNYAFAEKEKFETPLKIILDKIINLNLYVDIAEKDTAVQMLKFYKEQLPPPANHILIKIGYIRVYTEARDVKNLEKIIEEVKLIVEDYQVDYHKFFLYNAQGTLNEINNEYEQAIHNFQDALKIMPNRISTNIDIGRCFKKNKNFKKAKEFVNKAYNRFPLNPEYNYELALLYHDMGKQERALEHLNITLDVWKDADIEYIPAQKAREKLKEWEGNI